MIKTKLEYLLIGIIIIGLSSCEANQQTKNQNHASKEQKIEQFENLPDIDLISKDLKDNKYQTDLSNIEINTKLISLLEGTWTTQNGTIRFLKTTLETGDNVVFHDTTHSVMTGWGTIKYNRAVKFYFTKSGSHIYEFYILGDNRLVLTQYEYRDTDLSIKEKPKAIKHELYIDFINNNRLSLDNGEQVVELVRKKHKTDISTK